MKQLVFGTGDLAEMLFSNLQKEGIEVSAFLLTVEGDAKFCGKPVVPLRQATKLYPPGEYGVYICIGYKRMNMGRKKVFDEVSALGYPVLSYIHPTAQISGSYGVGIIAFQNVSVDFGAHMGIANILYPYTVVSHHTVIEDFNYFAPCSCVAGRVKIGSFCFIGANATLRDHISISDYSLLGAGCYVDSDTEPYAVVVPTRSLTLSGRKSIDINL